MPDVLQKTSSATELTDQSKTISLFQFIRELNKLKQKAILNMKDYPWFFSLSSLPEDPENISVFYPDRVADEPENEDGNRENVLLSVHKPEFQKCPEPDAILKDWLLPGWDSYRNEPEVKEFIELPPEKPVISLFDKEAEETEEEPRRELFADNAGRVKSYEKWIVLRSEWAAKQKITERTRNLFADLYRFYFELQREAETEEIIVANGILCDAENSEIRHPVLTHRVKIEYDADSNTVSMLNFGPDDSYRKRYNVAVSRARDQLWVVDSLDPTTDLKPGDIRKTLIDYSLNPKALEATHAEIEKKADSPFEVSVANALADRGYHLVQQWKVGSYRLDIVAVCGKKKVAIECDGERWHSGEEKIREDMERQTILERLGWRFIRIRGSEFYKDSEKTIERVISELTSYGITPEDSAETSSAERETELLKRVKARAYEILEGRDDLHPKPDLETIAVALDPKSVSPENEPSKVFEPSLVPMREKRDRKVEFGQENRADTVEASVKPKTPLRSVKPEQLGVKKTATSNTSDKTIAHSSPANKPGIRGNKPVAGQQSLFSTPLAGKNPAKRSRGDEFIEELKEHQIEFIDNRKQSNIVWVIYNKDFKDLIESSIRKYSLKATLERRGAIATGNRPAWRVMI